MCPRLASNSKRQIAVFLNYIKSELQNTIQYTTSDPGAKKVLVPRGSKRVERVQDHLQTSVNVLVCGTAKGDLLPPMVV